MSIQSRRSPPSCRRPNRPRDRRLKNLPSPRCEWCRGTGPTACRKFSRRSTATGLPGSLNPPPELRAAVVPKFQRLAANPTGMRMIEAQPELAFPLTVLAICAKQARDRHRMTQGATIVAACSICFCSTMSRRRSNECWP